MAICMPAGAARVCMARLMHALACASCHIHRCEGCIVNVTDLMLHTLLIRVSKSHLGSKLSLCSVLNRQMSSSWSVRGTSAGVGAVNAIRQCEEAHFVDALKQRNKELDLIKLSIG